MTEEWRPIADFPGYLVSTEGRIKGPHGLMKPWRAGSGYRQVEMYNHGQHRRLVHRLVLFAFVGPPGPGQEALHGNGCKSDNRLVNLRWGTRVENQADSRRHGTARRSRGNTKLSWPVVEHLRLAARMGILNKTRAARTLGVTPTAIYLAITGKTWQ